MAKSHFLQVEHMPSAFFQDFIDAGIKVVIWPDADKNFYKLNTEPVLSRKDILKVSETYKDYEMFGLSVVDKCCCSTVEFDLDKYIPEDCNVFIFIPKGSTWLEPDNLEHIKHTMEDYYNDSSNWFIWVVQNTTAEENSDEYMLYYDGDKFSTEDEQFFEKIKKEYGITDLEISETKRIVKTHSEYKFAGGNMCFKIKSNLEN